MRLTRIAPWIAALHIALALPSLAKQVDSGVPGMIFDHDVPVAMTDGEQLRVNIYRPEKSGRYPVFMLIDPLGRDVTFVGNSDPNVPLDLGYLRVSHRAVDRAKSTPYELFHPHVA